MVTSVAGNVDAECHFALAEVSEADLIPIDVLLDHIEKCSVCF